MKCYYCDSEATMKLYHPICKEHFDEIFEETINDIQLDGLIELSQDKKNVRLTEKGKEFCKELFGPK